MSDRDDPPLGVPDSYALRRRVLLTAAMTVGLFLPTAYAIAWLSDFKGTYDGFLLVVMALIYLLVTRPMMRPVRDAIKLRRRLAYEAWLAERGPESGAPP